MHRPWTVIFLDRIDTFDYAIPPERIAQEPAQPRDSARLLRLGATGEIEDYVFRDLPRLLHPGDLLVINETRVVKARLRGLRDDGGPAELLVLGARADGSHDVLARPARKLKPGSRLRFEGAEARMVEPGIVRFDPDVDVTALLERAGETPLPPYIVPPAGLDVEAAYQPVFARVSGSVAATYRIAALYRRTTRDDSPARRRDCSARPQRRLGYLRARTRRTVDGA